MAATERVTRNFHSVARMARELTDGLPAIDADAALALLVCDCALPAAALAKEVAAALPCPLVGGTTLALPMAEEDSTSARLVVFAREELLCAAVATPPLGEGEGQARAAYKACLAALGAPPKMLLALLPRADGCDPARFAEDLFACAGTLPVFGGMLTDDVDEGRARVFLNGEAYEDRGVLVALGGGIRPVFSTAAAMTVLSTASYAPVITKADFTTLYTADGAPFCDFMQSMGLEACALARGGAAQLQYGPLPAMLSGQRRQDDGVPDITCLRYTNPADGSAVFATPLREGARIIPGFVQKQDIADSAAQCARWLAKAMEQNRAEGYDYSLVCGTSSAVRYFAQAGGDDIESMLLSSALPSGLCAQGWYSYMEMAPTLHKNGVAQNRSHAGALALFAL